MLLVVVGQGFEPPVLIFVQSKERAKALFNELVYDELRVDVIHADRTQAQVCFITLFIQMSSLGQVLQSTVKNL